MSKPGIDPQLAVRLQPWSCPENGGASVCGVVAPD